MCIERNREILFWGRAKSRAWRYVRNCSGMQLVLPNPTTLAIPATAGLVHYFLTLLVISGQDRLWAGLRASTLYRAREVGCQA